MGPARGLEEAELEKLVASGEISPEWPLLYSKVKKMEDLLMKSDGFSLVGCDDREIEHQVLC